MDLKPWQCGLCQFRSMLRVEVAEHCAKCHQSKMQFKCGHCPFRTSTFENVTKHHAHSHPGKPENVFYYYYREGTIPDEGGVPRWQRQRDRSGLTAKPDVEPSVDLNLVKTEVEEPVQMSKDQLRAKYGQFCKPEGLHYKCPMCNTLEMDKQEMVAHLYEELQYRKWGCACCTYKAFSANRLKEHMAVEHCQIKDPIETATNVNIERWVDALLEHQSALIAKNKEALKPKPSPSKLPDPRSLLLPVQSVPESSKKDIDDKTLIEAFGEFGTPKDMQFSCPKCEFRAVEKDAMMNHLEWELNKIRWKCSVCPSKFQTYHEAQFHTKSHGAGARPEEAPRDPALRRAWPAAALARQGALLATAPGTSQDTSQDTGRGTPEHDDNSLLVVRYEQDAAGPAPRARSSSSSSDEPAAEGLRCPHCDFSSKYPSSVRDHVYRHYRLKPYTCVYCNDSFYKARIHKHTVRAHPDLPPKFVPTPVPDAPPLVVVLPRKRRNDEDDETKLTCLTCDRSVPETAAATHLHDGEAELARKGDVVVKCCLCLCLRLTVDSYRRHHAAAHAAEPENYAFFKLHHDHRETLQCDHCSQRFKFARDMRSHHNAMHSSLPLKYKSSAHEPAKRKAEDPIRRVAKKSTTKLPRTLAVARKSTTRLPEMHLESDSDEDEDFSYYGSKPPPPEQYANVITETQMFNRTVRLTVKKLREIIEMDPLVVVTDVLMEQ